MIKQAVTICIGCFLLASGIQAQTNLWTSTTSGNWTNTLGWSLGTVPTASEEVWHTTYANTVSVTTAAEANTLLVGKNDTSTVLVATGGSLTVGGDAEIGNAGTTGIGELVVDGGSASVGGRLSFGLFGTARQGIGELNSGSITVSGETWLGGNNTGTGMLTINGGTYTATSSFFYVGKTGAGTLNMNGGTLQLHTDSSVWQPLRVGHNGGDGTLNLNGGTINTRMVVMDNDATGSATINLNAGLLQVEGSFSGAVSVNDDAQMAFDAGVFKWKGSWVANITTLVDGGSITWTNGVTNMLTMAWDASWTNGASVLYADYNDANPGYTTVWAFDTNSIVPPVEGPSTNVFNNGSGDGLYTTPGNWDIGSVPTTNDLALHTSIGGVCLVDSSVGAGALEVSHISTAAVSVVTGGSLNVTNGIELAANVGAVGSVGKLLVDGGSVYIGGDLTCGLFGTRHGLGELNSGILTVGGATYLGGFNADSQGTMTINGGTCTATNGFFYVGRNSGAGTLNMNGGTLQLDPSGTVFNPLRVGNGTGDGIINLNDGSINTGGLIVDNTAGGAATVNLNAGLLQIEGAFAGAVQLNNAAQIVFDKGVFKWKGSMLDSFTNLVAGGAITWTNGMTNMLTESWEYSWTNGSSVLYADYDDANAGYTTVWAFDTTPAQSGYSVFSTQYSLVEGILGDDDNDGLSNLGEYALNGNPTNAADKGLMEFHVDGAWFTFIHASNVVDDSIIYRLLDQTNLLGGTVRTNGWDSQTIGPMEGDYAAVSNHYSTDGRVLFIKLQVGQ